MTKTGVLLCAVLAAVSFASTPTSTDKERVNRNTYLGFDRNDYPGDENLSTLRKTFSYTSYWLNNPPGAANNTWKGERRFLGAAGFGFLVLYTGKTYAQLKTAPNPAVAGRHDAREAVQAAQREGFPPGTVIFLDQEEGGRLLPEQKAYLYAFVDGVNGSGFRAGVYCSGVPFTEAGGSVVITAEDIRKNAKGRRIVYWVSNDTCPPSPGCAVFQNPPSPKTSGVPFADVWQYAQSPRRPQYTSACEKTYAPDGNCYRPELQQKRIHLDLNTADSPDPSHGR